MSFRHPGVVLAIAAALVLAPGALSAPSEEAGGAFESGVWTDWLHAGEGESVPAPMEYEIAANQNPLDHPWAGPWLSGQGMLRSVGTTIYQRPGGGVQGQVLMRGSDLGALRADFEPLLEPVEDYSPVYTMLAGVDPFFPDTGIMARVTGVDTNSGPSTIVAEILSVVDGEIDDTLAYEVTAFDEAEGMVLAGSLYLVVDGELELVATPTALSPMSGPGGWVGVGIETEAGYELGHGISGISVTSTSEWSGPEVITATDGDTGLATVHRDYAFSDWIRAYDFGFASEIPAGSTILGVEVRSTQRTEGHIAEYIFVESVRLWPDDGPEGDDRSTGDFWSDPGDETEYVVYSYGGASDLWGLSLTRADVVSEDFGWVQRGLLDSANGSLLVDSMEMRIRYEPPE